MSSTGVAPSFLVAAIGGFLVSVVAVAASLHYGRRRGLIDHPGRRRLHAQPTPRGGGIGIVAAALACAVPLLLSRQTMVFTTVATLAVAVFAVAAIGWRDDHAPLPVLPRIGVHVLTGAAVAAVLLMPMATSDPRWWWLPVIAIVIAGSINAYNFMDGIDGLLGLQGLFVFSGYALLAHSSGQFALAAASIAIASACLGFLMFNLPAASIFMGDVGSGTLGLLVAAFAGLLVQHSLELLWPCAILSSAFLVDAGLTLLQRVLAGRRWYTAHREHLYQWMVRTGSSHARTDGTYMLWNLIVAAPAAWMAMRRPQDGPALCAMVYVFAGAIRYSGKRACLAVVRSRSHARA